MATADRLNLPASFPPNSLPRRADRGRKVMHLMQVAEVPRFAVELRRVAKRQLRQIHESEDIGEQIALTESVCRVIDRILDITGWQKRPAATSAKGAARIDLATILEAHPSEEPCTVEPVTEPAKPAESGPNTASDELPPKQ